VDDGRCKRLSEIEADRDRKSSRGSPGAERTAKFLMESADSESDYC
jgi:hypothetical protein